MKALHEAGFGAIEIKQITPALWVASSFIVGMFARQGKATKQLRNPALVSMLLLSVRCFLFPLLYFGNSLGRGDCLLAVAMLPRVQKDYPAGAD